MQQREEALTCFFGGGQGYLPNARGPKASGVIRRAKEKQSQKAGSWDANPSPSEPKSNRSSKEGRDQDAEPCMFVEVIVQHLDQCLEPLHTNSNKYPRSQHIIKLFIRSYTMTNSILQSQALPINLIELIITNPNSISHFNFLHIIHRPIPCCL
jgi:hypothetical protein